MNCGYLDGVQAHPDAAAPKEGPLVPWTAGLLDAESDGDEAAVQVRLFRPSTPTDTFASASRPSETCALVKSSRAAWYIVGDEG